MEYALILCFQWKSAGSMLDWWYLGQYGQFPGLPGNHKILAMLVSGITREPQDSGYAGFILGSGEIANGRTVLGVGNGIVKYPLS